MISLFKLLPRLRAKEQHLTKRLSGAGHSVVAVCNLILESWPVPGTKESISSKLMGTRMLFGLPGKPGEKGNNCFYVWGSISLESHEDRVGSLTTFDMDVEGVRLQVEFGLFVVWMTLHF